MSEEQTERGFVQLLTAFEADDAVMAERSAQLVGERSRQAFTVDVQRVQVGTEMLALAARHLGRLDLVSPAIPRQLTDVGEDVEHADLGLQQR